MLPKNLETPMNLSVFTTFPTKKLGYPNIFDKSTPVYVDILKNRRKFLNKMARAMQSSTEVWNSSENVDSS